MKRPILFIDQDKCDGCGACLPNCAEGALIIEDGKLRLVEDKLCDGLGACLSHCPKDALKLIERDAVPFDEEAVHQRLAELATPKPKAAPGGCPGQRAMRLDGAQLQHWPVKLRLCPETAPFFSGADLLLLADCAPLALPNFTADFVAGKTPVIACPKFEGDLNHADKLAAILAAGPASLTVVAMEVPCCGGLLALAREAVARSGFANPYKEWIATRQGELVAPQKNGPQTGAAPAGFAPKPLLTQTRL